MRFTVFHTSLVKDSSFKGRRITICMWNWYIALKPQGFVWNEEMKKKTVLYYNVAINEDSVGRCNEDITMSPTHGS